MIPDQHTESCTRRVDGLLTTGAAQTNTASAAKLKIDESLIFVCAYNEVNSKDVCI